MNYKMKSFLVDSDSWAKFQINKSTAIKRKKLRKKRSMIQNNSKRDSNNSVSVKVENLCRIHIVIHHLRNVSEIWSRYCLFILQDSNNASKRHEHIDSDVASTSNSVETIAVHDGDSVFLFFTV